MVVPSPGAEGQGEGSLVPVSLVTSHPHNQPIFLAGPTAVGKSAVAFELAQRIGGEIISVDSMQVYRGLDIGTAKPAATERRLVPHHLIDVVDVTERFDAAKFVARARLAVVEIQSRGRVPIFCGGTGLYFKAFLEGLGEAPAADPSLRAELEATPLPELLRELEKFDPATFQTIDRQNPRRIIRAIEVIRRTGKPFSEQRAEWQHPPRLAPRTRQDATLSPSDAEEDRIAPQTTRLLCLTRSAADLRTRIDSRVDEMFARGLVEETRQLLERGLGQNMTAMQALGYRQVFEHLRGQLSLADTIELVKVRTRQFAKRQMTWFRRQPGVKWIELAPKDEMQVILSRLSLN
jgi:tRNA dimethylallyltransferase